jgi:hypothetical protein
VIVFVVEGGTKEIVQKVLLVSGHARIAAAHGDDAVATGNLFLADLFFWLFKKNFFSGTEQINKCSFEKRDYK